MMPNFSWTGVDIVGTRKRGVTAAASKQHLDERLYAQRIALVSCHISHKLNFTVSCSANQFMRLFEMLYLLLQAGVAVQSALMLAADQTLHTGLQDCLVDIADRITQGSSIADAFSQHHSFFSPLVIQIIAAGEQSGSLIIACKTLMEHYKTIESISSQVRRFLLVPVISFIVFTVVSFIIVLLIVPQFNVLYKSLGLSLPVITHYMIMVGDSLKSWYGISFLLVTISLIVLVGTYVVIHRKRSIASKPVQMILNYSKLSMLYVQMHLFRALGMLLARGVSIPTAFTIISESTTSGRLKHSLNVVLTELNNGTMLSDACMHDPVLFPSEVIALFEVGQQSGSLAQLCHVLADRFHEQFQLRLSRMGSLVHPCLMIILGLCVGLLLLSLYLPICTLSTSHPLI